MLIDIKNRFTGSVIFSLETSSMRLCVEAAVKSGANLAGAYLADAYLNGANLNGANLTGANLAGAYLADANLADANLTGAYLTGAKIKTNITITKPPIFLLGLRWRISIFDAHMQIGCEFHSHDEWAAFDDKTIAAMDGRDALKFWNENKDVLLTLCRNHAARAEKKTEAA